MNSEIRKKCLDMFQSWDGIQTVIDSNKEALNEGIKALSEETGIDKKILRQFLSDYHKGKLTENKERSIEYADFVDLMNGTGTNV